MEQAFSKKKEDKTLKKIVDIVILCYVKIDSKKENLAQKLLSPNKNNELKQIILIENKIKDDSSDILQLEDQFEFTKSKLEEIDNIRFNKDTIDKLTSIIYVTPDAQKSRKNYADFNEKYKNAFSAQLFWYSMDDDENETGISKELKSIIENENAGLIEAIPDYTKHTIKSFINFIDNDFKSSIEEELEGVLNKPKKVFDNKIEYYYYKSKSDGIHENIIDLSKQIGGFINSRFYAGKLIHRYSPTHYSFFIKEFHYKNGSKLATMELFPNKVGIHFRNKNIEGVLDKIKLTPIIQKSWPDLRFFNFTQFTDSEKNDLSILLKESFKSVTSANNQ